MHAPRGRDQPADLAAGGGRPGARRDRPDHRGDDQRRRPGRRPRRVRAGAHARATPASLVASGPDRHRREQHVPLRVAGLRQGQRPSRPSRSPSPRSTSAGRTPTQFTFNPPPGTKVTERTLPAHPGTQKMGMAHPDPEAAPSTAAGEPKVVGKGWSSVVVATVPPQSQSGSGDQQSLKAMLELLPRVSGIVGRGPPAGGQAVLRGPHRRRPGRRRRGHPADPVRRTGRSVTDAAVATSGLTKRFGQQVAVTPSTWWCRGVRSTASSAPTARARPPRSGCCSA